MHGVSLASQKPNRSILEKRTNVLSQVHFSSVNLSRDRLHQQDQRFDHTERVVESDQVNDIVENIHIVRLVQNGVSRFDHLFDEEEVKLMVVFGGNDEVLAESPPEIRIVENALICENLFLVESSELFVSDDQIERFVS